MPGRTPSRRVGSVYVGSSAGTRRVPARSASLMTARSGTPRSWASARRRASTSGSRSIVVRMAHIVDANDRRIKMRRGVERRWPPPGRRTRAFRSFRVYFGLMRRLSLSAIAATAALGLSAAPALAKTAPSHKPTTGPVHATARIYLHDAFFVHHRTIDVARRPITVSGWLSRFVPRQTVTLSARVGSHVTTLRLKVRPNPGGRTGRFGASITAPAPGILHLRIVHHASPRLAPLHAGRGVDIISESTRNPLFAQLVQQRLLALHLYMPQSGVWDLQTELAIEAYHRLLGRGTSAALDPATLTALLDGRGAFP